MRSSSWMRLWIPVVACVSIAAAEPPPSRVSKLKWAAAWFNGREPDENRYNFDFRELDSCSGRISFDPTSDWSLQTSYGYLASPEELEPDTSVHRLTASAAYHHRIGADLEPFDGTRTLTGSTIFLHVHPTAMADPSMHHHEHGAE